MFIRQAHPGPGVPPYDTYEEKRGDAVVYKESQFIPWTVLVDDVEGRVHQVYGRLPHPTYLINAEGRVAFYNLWTHAPSLHRALVALTRPDGACCVVRGGIDRTPHILASLANGWPGIERGLPQSSIDLQRAAPGMPSVFKLGYRLKPLLAPIALRSTPLSPGIRAVMGGTGLYIGSRLTSHR